MTLPEAIFPFTLGTLSTLDKRWHQSLAFPVLLSGSIALFIKCLRPTNSRSQFADQRSKIFRCRNLSYKMKFDIWWSKCYCSPFPFHLGKPLWVSISVDLRPNPTDMVLPDRKIGLASFKGVWSAKAHVLSIGIFLCHFKGSILRSEVLSFTIFSLSKARLF